MKLCALLSLALLVPNALAGRAMPPKDSPTHRLCSAKRYCARYVPSCPPCAC